MSLDTLWYRHADIRGPSVGGDTNITHNLRQMAEALGVGFLWSSGHRDEPPMQGKDMVRPVAEALVELLVEPERYAEFDAPNGWGTTEGMERFLRSVLREAQMFPEFYYCPSI